MSAAVYQENTKPVCLQLALGKHCGMSSENLRYLCFFNGFALDMNSGLLGENLFNPAMHPCLTASQYGLCHSLYCIA